MNRYAYDYTQKTTEVYNGAPLDQQQIVGFIFIGVFLAFIMLLAFWPRIKEWIKRVWYRNYTIKSFVICQKTPDIDMKKIYTTVDNANDFLRGKTLVGIKATRKKIKSKRLISVSSIPGRGCYYFIVWYRG